LAAHRLTIYAYNPAFANRAVTSGPYAQHASACPDGSGDGPASGRGGVIVGILSAIDVGQPGRTQSSTWREKGYGLQQIRLSGTVGTGQHYRLST